MEDKWPYCGKHSGVERDIAALKERMEYIITAQEKALDVAKREVDRRLEGMNNFQHRMDRLENTFATKMELDAVKQTQAALHLDHSAFATKESVQTMQRLIWIGIGLFAAMQIAFKFMISR